MSKRSKGNQWETEVRKILESEGYIVEKAHARLVWIKGRPISMSHDFYGAWDLIAKKGGFKTLWAQVSSIAHVSDKRSQIASFPWTSDFDDCRIYGRIPNSRLFRVYYAKDDYAWMGDTAEVPKLI